MSWSKVTKEHKKPLMWWYHKIMCEYYYSRYDQVRKYDVTSHLTKYYHHLKKLCKYGFNLYGEKI